MNKLIEKYALELSHSCDLTPFYIEEFLERYSQELLSSDIDFRTLMKYRDWTTEALWYLGDKAQLDYHNNGWENYRFKNLMSQRHKLPNKSDYYYVIIDGIIMKRQWFDSINLFNQDDDLITHWKQITYPKD